MNINFDLLQFYVYKRLVKRRDAETILEESRKLRTNVRDYMLVKEITTEAEELAALSEYYNIPAIEIDMLDINRELFDKLSFEFMKRNKVIPVSRQKNGKILLAVGRPLDCTALSAVASAFTGPFDYVLTPPSQINRYIDSVSAVISTSKALDDLNGARDQELFVGNENFVENEFTGSDEDVINNPSVRLVDSIIREAIPYRASDIHIEPFDRQVRVRYRIDGDLQERANFPIESYPSIAARIKIMSGMNIAEHRMPQDGRIEMNVGGKDYDFRVAAMPTIFGEKFVIRILDKSTFHYDRNTLGFTDEENELVDKMLSRPHGIILLTGPTGCGKSTTLYAFLKEINKIQRNIITVEDPVEYTMGGINQVQVNEKANLTFASATRALLRQDPDVIMIGEIRDEETAQIAVRSAITGHLVFSTLHTNDAPGAILRLENMGVEDYLVGDALVGVIAQRLVKKLCPACKRRGRTTAAEMRALGIDEPVTISRPQGCQFCNNTGYKGRVAVHEIMYMSEDMRNASMSGANLNSLRKTAQNNGMVTLQESCAALVLNGTTSIEELETLSVE